MGVAEVGDDRCRGVSRGEPSFRLATQHRPGMRAWLSLTVDRAPHALHVSRECRAAAGPQRPRGHPHDTKALCELLAAPLAHEGLAPMYVAQPDMDSMGQKPHCPRPPPAVRANRTGRMSRPVRPHHPCRPPPTIHALIVPGRPVTALHVPVSTVSQPSPLGCHIWPQRPRPNDCLGDLGCRGSAAGKRRPQSETRLQRSSAARNAHPGIACTAATSPLVDGPGLGPQAKPGGFTAATDDLVRTSTWPRTSASTSPNPSSRAPG